MRTKELPNADTKLLWRGKPPMNHRTQHQQVCTRRTRKAHCKPPAPWSKAHQPASSVTTHRGKPSPQSKSSTRKTRMTLAQRTRDPRTAANCPRPHKKAYQTPILLVPNVWNVCFAEPTVAFITAAASNSFFENRKDARLFYH